MAGSHSPAGFRFAAVFTNSVTDGRRRRRALKMPKLSMMPPSPSTMSLLSGWPWSAKLGGQSVALRSMAVPLVACAKAAAMASDEMPAAMGTERRFEL